MISILVETTAYEGVRKIAEKSAGDFELVFGKKPELLDELMSEEGEQIVYATLGNSVFLESINDPEINSLSGKRECYCIKHIGNRLVVAGSDKRGTIYGIFNISEQIGVSPLVFWGDAKPAKKKSFSIKTIVDITSKEPSVKYRGFFINDEWPCFGNWTFENFGGFTAKMYDHVFELLLRLKGNCLWPAMWSSSFALDGPGGLNEELADCYGVIMNYSHHEPCLRASEEWDKVKGDDTPYGSQWNYATNRQGLLNYWRDGLKRSGRYENIVTMGMRGERDSQMQGVNTLADSINFWKEIIKEQDKLVTEYADTKDFKHPRLVAIYKEVEDYFFGDGTTKGLEGMDILDDMLLMFCEDNFGYMRRLPQGKLRNHPGGLGMYYHFDYHGDPVSYEWINSTQLSKCWEQMTTAYEHGIREMWMVNVGDLKGNEIPLSYFMNLAYDYEKWGISNIHSHIDYMADFAKFTFADERVARLYTNAIDLISYRKPEALSPYTYALENGEADMVLAKAIELLEELELVKKELKKHALEGFYSMVEYPVKIGLNHIMLHIYSMKNEHYAKQGKVVANEYATSVSRAYEIEKKLIKEFKEFNDGKWSGMELASHTGFTKWNEDGARKPLRYMVEPLSKPHLLVSRSDDSYVAAKNYGTYDRIIVDDFLYTDRDSVSIELANDGQGSLFCQVRNIGKVVKSSWLEKEITSQEILLLTVDRFVMEKEEETHIIELTDGDTVVELEVRIAKEPCYSRYGVSIPVDRFTYIRNTEEFSYQLIQAYGKHGMGLKCFPVNMWPTANMAPRVGYQFDLAEAGEYTIRLCIAPTSPLDGANQLKIGCLINGQENREINTIKPGYKAGNAVSEEWALGVLEQERRVDIKAKLKAGVNTLELYAIDPGLVVEKLMVFKNQTIPTYFGF